MKKILMGYNRDDGKYGIRNKVMVISLVQCSNILADTIAKACQVNVVAINDGCGEFNEHEERTNLGIIRAGTHPNVYGVLLVSLGCQWTDPDYISGEIEKQGRKVYHLCMQTDGGHEGCVKKGIEIVERMKLEAIKQEREPFQFSELVIATYAGGSDWTSGLAANNVVGLTTDMVINYGGSAFHSGVKGAPGNEMHLAEHASSYEVGLKIVELINEFRKDILEITGQTISDRNPTPGNKEGGLTTLREKATGTILLTGESPIQGIIKPGDLVPYPGNWYQDNRAGGSGAYVFTGLGMSHAHLILFTTGRGTPSGHACAPTIKITANAETFKQHTSWFDYCTCSILEGKKTVEECAQEIFDLMVEVINGKLVRQEINGYYTYLIPPIVKM